MHAKNKSSVRIISGTWRSQKVYFPNELSIRPTLDQVRETLFNWLDPYITGSVCLDLFAGSGAFAFEALSRGAQHVTCIDNDLKVVQSLQDNADRLATTKIDIIQGNAYAFLKTLSKKYDVVFLDPPFNQELLATGIMQLKKLDILSAHALIYFECEISLDVPALCEQIKILKSKKTKHIQYGLISFESFTADN